MVSRSSVQYIKKKLGESGAPWSSDAKCNEHEGALVLFRRASWGIIGFGTSPPWALQDERLSQDIEDKETLLSGQEMNQNEKFLNSLAGLQS